MKTRIDKATYQRLIAEKDFRLATQKMKIADAITLLPNLISRLSHPLQRADTSMKTMRKKAY